jgi:signal-transduction protein with cAMP-binding, CBS, and nucleotidyltransferase domain
MEATKYVIDIATETPVVIGPDTLAWSAEHLAEQRGVHYLLVVDGYHLRGIVCLCDLLLASASSRVSACMHEKPLTVDDQATATEAAEMMASCQIGCLPVVDWTGGLKGIVTRHDLQRAGILGDGVVHSCASCGSTHGLRDDVHDGEPCVCFRCAAQETMRLSDADRTLSGPAA